jgi:hypothetical protein
MKFNDLLKTFEGVQKALEKAGKKHCHKCGLPTSSKAHNRVCVDLKGKGDPTKAKFDKKHTKPTRP